MDGRLSVGAIKNELRATWETRTKKAQVLNVEVLVIVERRFSVVLSVQKRVAGRLVPVAYVCLVR